MSLVASPVGAGAARPRYPLFDSIRIMAAITVIVSHSYALLGHPEPQPVSFAGYPLTLGTLAVGVFFIVSGFLITASWEANRSIWAYSVKRVFRIWPALIVVVVGAAYLLGPLVTTLSGRAYLKDPATWAYVKNNITMIPITNTLPGVFTSLPVPAVNGSLWTLPYEVLCYIGVAAVGLLGILKHRWMVLVLALLSLAWCESVFRDPTGWWSFVPYVGLIALLVVLLVPWFCVGAAMRSWHTAVPSGPLPGAAAVVVLGLGVALDAPALIIPGIGFLTIWVGTLPFSWHLPKWAGDPSYGMYVFAFPIQQCLIYFHLCANRVPVLIAEATVVSFVAGVISWHLLERPAVAAGARLSKAPRRAWQRSRNARVADGTGPVEESPVEESPVEVEPALAQVSRARGRRRGPS